MRSRYRCLLLVLVIMTVFSVTTIAAERIKTFTFEGINSINIRSISGNIRICPGNENKLLVELKNDLEEPELLSPQVEADHEELTIEERFTGNSVRGETNWTVYLPMSDSLHSIECNSASGNMLFEKFRVDFIKTESASGEVLADSVNAKEFEFSTASGSITVNTCDVNFVKISSASGDISLGSVHSKELELSTASGSIAVEDSKIEDQGKMTSASGDVEIYLPQLPSLGLKVSTASSDVILKVPSFGENFSMILMKREDKGGIKCPFEYTDKSTFRNHDNNDYLMERYLIKRGTNGPEIKLGTSSGAIRIETDAKRK